MPVERAGWKRRAVRTAARAWATALLLVGVGACGGGAQQADDGLVLSSDPELRALAAELLPGLARRAAMELSAPVRIERRSRAELETYLRTKLDEEFPPEEAALTVDAYAMLGLVPGDLDLRALLLALYTEQVAGFYEPDSTALFVMDDQPTEALEGLLLHELVHAVQDQSVDLSAITDPALGNDRGTAAQAAIEGHATLVMLEFMMERMSGRPVDLSEVPSLASRLLPALDAMEAQFPALASAPEVVRRSLLFPYVEGSSFVQRLWSDEGRVAPFGPFLPGSTEQVIEGDLTDAPLAVSVDVADVRVLDDDVLGRLETQVLLETHLGAEAGSLAEGWGGDRYVLLEQPDSGSRALVWVTAWDSEAARDRFVSRLGGALDGFARGASLEATMADGWPAAVLTVGAESPLTVSAGAAAAP